MENLPGVLQTGFKRYSGGCMLMLKDNLDYRHHLMGSLQSNLAAKWLIMLGLCWLSM